MAQISIIVPVYQVEKYLKRCIASILQQTFTDYEVILVDDGSFDSSGTICDEYSAQDSRIHVIHQENGGLSAARNTGLEYVFSQTDSEWITFIDSDDWIHPLYLSALINAANSCHTSIAACQHVKTHIDTTNIFTEISNAIYDTGLYYKTYSSTAWGKLYKRETIGNLRFPFGKIHEDEFFVYKVLFQYQKIAVVEQSLYYYFQNDNGIMRSKWTPKRLDAIAAMKEQMCYFEDHGLADLCEYTYQRLLKNYAFNLNQLKNYAGLPDQEKEDLIKSLENDQKDFLQQYSKYDLREEKEKPHPQNSVTMVTESSSEHAQKKILKSEKSIETIDHKVAAVNHHNSSGMIGRIIHTIKERQFLFEELVKRDFKQKYKRTVLGMAWSILSPLLSLLVMRLVFTRFFGRGIDHYTTYLFAGNLMFSYFRESTNGGMQALMSNANIFTKINVPKYLFLFSKSVSAVINFSLTLVVFFIFVAIDGVPFRPSMFGVIYPIITLTMLNVGLGMILSALFVFFRDTQYLYDIFTMLLMYMSAIFYNVDAYSVKIQRLFLLNPVYCNIKYIRVAVLDGHLPSLAFHGLLLFYGALALGLGCFIYKKYNTKFLYYV